MTLLEIRDLHAGYDQFDILHGIQLHVEPGELVAIIGPNGAGKSTVLKSIYNLADVRRGSITLNQEPLNGLRPHELLSHGVSYIPQGRINFSQLSVEENLEIAAQDEEQKNYVYELFPILKEKARQPAYSLSCGQHQMLALGRALMHKPKLLLMDEPSLGLSPKLVEELFDIISDLTAEDIGVLLVEQNAKQAIKAADRTILLEQGEIALSGANIETHKKIKQVYLGGDIDE